VTEADLAQWHTRLADHFARLRVDRDTAAESRPVFALEHGLDAVQRDALTKAIRAHIANNAPGKDQELPWVAYAAELGYRYSGDEYWQTFEEETPGWTAHGSRYWIRDCYRWFKKEYGGAQPSGRWAEWFSIICWPITHAILPRDLQRQLARILFEIRGSYSAESFENPVRLGELISARSWNVTSRFQNFAQETVLVGQIAAALLLEGEFGTSTLIYQPTLERIAEDLERERLGREWLRSARGAARQRARIRGLASKHGSGVDVPHRADDVRAEIANLGIEPRLVLRPVDPVASSWEARLEIPDLSHLLSRFPSTREALTGARCVIAGSAGRPLARGRLLHGAQRVLLSRWPRSDEVLLQFEQSNPQLDFLLRAEFLLRPGPTWLFRIASDGLAYASRGLGVRAGERYIIVTSDGPVDAIEYVQPIDLRCQGVYGALLELPSALTSDREEGLRRLGLGQAKKIEVWPAGLVAVVWDDEGHSEWLAAERPCLAIRTDHKIETLDVSIAGSTEPPLTLAPITPGEPVFIELPQLPVGLHTFRLFARTRPETATKPLGDLDVVVRIREARPWSRGVNPNGPLVVYVEPPAPSLEQLWEGQVDIEVRGPAGREVECAVSLFDRQDDLPSFVARLPPLQLPVIPARWRAHFEEHFRETKKGQNHYDTARLCKLEFDAKELGTFTVQSEREFAPLRWAVRRNRKDSVVRLFDDTGEAGPPEVLYSTFDWPAVQERLEPAPEYIVSGSGGLYMAQHKGFNAAVVAVSTLLRSFAEFDCVPQLNLSERSPEAVIHGIELAQLWGSAKSSGDIFSQRNRRKVLYAIARHISLLVGGKLWANAERQVENGGDLSILERAVSRRREEVELAAALARELAELADATLERRISRLGNLATSFHFLSQRVRGGVGSDSPGWIVEFALRLASDPMGVGAWAGHQLRAGVTQVLGLSALWRASRLLVIAIDRHRLSLAPQVELYAGWEWT